ncbi:MAG: TIGR02281 family clan AA aspartic protease [Paracoccaceae bacterium]|jgi:aspartyl protease family protein|nr:TIGR02281 family clan AA aspartic protease [Paracoccaceae bacterium]
MTGDQIASLAYLGLLLVVIGGWFFMQNRKKAGKMTQMAVVWGLIFLGVIAAKGLWDDIRRTTMPMQSVNVGGQIELPRSGDGHFYAVIDLNGQPIEFVVDTGATQIVLSASDARKVGLDPDNLPFLGRAETANGVISIAYDTIDRMSFGPYVDENIGVSISKAEMGTSLLGMSYLGSFDVLQIIDNRMILSRNTN